jgi:leader peptidase (prepilin peptidase)/N-methyltransferase
MTTILIIIAATGLGAAIGVWTRKLLAPLTYRLEEEHELAEPGSRVWLIVVSGLALGSVTAWLAYADNWPLALAVLPLTLAAPALAAIDLDVMRLPNRILGPTALLTIASVAIAGNWSGDWMVLARASAGALLSGGTFWLLNVVTRGGIGLGDVKLAALIGLATGSVSLPTVWWAIAAGTLLALIWRKACKRTGAFAYGPYLLLGSWLAVLSSAW